MFDTLKNTINNNITSNRSRDVTGSKLNGVLNNIVSVVGEGGAVFLGVLAAGATAATPIRPAFYLACAAGTYSVGGTSYVVTESNKRIYLFYYNGTAWSATDVAQNMASGVVRGDISQSLTENQKSVARENISATESGTEVSVNIENNTILDYKSLSDYQAAGKDLMYVVVFDTDKVAKLIDFYVFKEIVKQA